MKACHKILILSMLYFQLLYIEFNKLAGLRKQSTLKNQYGTKNNVFRSCDRRCSLSQRAGHFPLRILNPEKLFFRIIALVSLSVQLELFCRLSEFGGPGIA